MKQGASEVKEDERKMVTCLGDGSKIAANGGAV